MGKFFWYFQTAFLQAAVNFINSEGLSRPSALPRIPRTDLSIEFSPLGFKCLMTPPPGATLFYASVAIPPSLRQWTGNQPAGPAKKRKFLKLLPKFLKKFNN